MSDQATREAEATITLRVFVSGLVQQLRAFEAHWAACRREKPDDWPMRMAEGDWQEQFLVWTDGTENDDGE